MATKQSAPFWDFDVTRMMGDFRMPGMDAEAVMTAQRKNVEALTAANQRAMEGMQEVARRHVEIMRRAVEDMTASVAEFATAGTPEAKVAKQADLTKASFERTLAGMRELSEMLAKSNAEAADIINRRIAAMLDETGKKPDK
ncbi:phasin family protein [Inquilinus sp. CAU 1745]|uniref:phasin family protein n=1 Tax=Inquilinus sp. CAU 1745 TaxID=3140369 RepID=UPI00325AC165